MSGTLLTEVPSSLKQLARLVVRGFYTIEDTLIVDMLVRNPCMKEDDLCELLKFERKMLRARIATLRTDKFIQVRLRMETGADGKAQKVNYYFINYKTFVNVVKYKLDVIRKRLETEERDATRRASFKCPGCAKTFTDLEADQLFDPMSEDFRCTHCHEIVEEDQAALPKKDSRVILARFNEQMEPLYILLREVDGIDLAPEILEPEPVDINMIRGVEGRKANGSRNHELWSGDHSRSQGFAVEDTRIDVTISDNNVLEQNTVVRKERPIWMVQSTVVSNEQSEANTATTDTTETMLETVATNSQNAVQPRSEDIMSVLLAHEKRANNTANALKNIPGEESDSDSLEMDDIKNDVQLAEVGVMDSEDEDSQPQVQVGHRTYLLQDINDEHIACMTPAEKEAYIQTYQEYYSHIYD